jgi:polysaccharide export outer membrane protein
MRHVAALSLTGVYAIASTLPGALLLWAVSSSTSIPVAVGQTLPNSSPSSPEPQRSSNEQLLRDARQDLIDPDELPTTPLPDVNTDGSRSYITPAVELNPDFERYRLGPGDSIFANVLRFPDLSFAATLDINGNVVVPLVGVLSLQGLTVAQAQDRIQTRLNQFVIDPKVDLILTAQRPVQVTIDGEVVRPGLYPLQAPQLAVAIATAGGTTNYADLRDVRIRRSRDGGFIEQDIDLYGAIRESNSIPNIRLEDGDTIIIPTLNASNSATYDRYLISRTTLAQQQIVVRVLNYSAGVGGAQGGGGGITSLTLPNGSSFLDAIVQISPNPDRADLGDVALIRFDPEQGKAVVREFHAKNALLGDASQNPPLEDDDVIVVGRNFISRVTYALNTFTQPFRDILGFLLFFDSLADSADNLFRPDNGDNND